MIPSAYFYFFLSVGNKIWKILKNAYGIDHKIERCKFSRVQSFPPLWFIKVYPVSLVKYQSACQCLSLVWGHPLQIKTPVRAMVKLVTSQRIKRLLSCVQPSPYYTERGLADWVEHFCNSKRDAQMPWP